MPRSCRRCLPISCPTARGESLGAAWSSPCHAGLPSPRHSRGCRPKPRPTEAGSRVLAADHESSPHPPAQPRDPFCSILQLCVTYSRLTSSSTKKGKKVSPFRIRRRLQFHPGSRKINVEIVARRCSSTSEMKYLLLKVEKRCQTTIEKILKSIVDERRSPNLLAARIWPRPAGAAGRTTTLALRGCPRTTTLAYDRALISKGCRTRGLRALL